MALMRERQPCVYLLTSKFYGRLYVGVTSNLLERENLAWNDLAVGLGLEPLE